MKTTLGKIKSFNPCVPGWKKLCKSLGTTNLDTEVSILQILEINGVEDAFWALRTQEYEDYCIVIADIEESTLHIFEEEHPKDVRPRNLIQAIRNYKVRKISKKELITFHNSACIAYNAVAYDAVNTTTAAATAANAAASVYAADAANDTDVDATYAYAAVVSAAVAAYYAADADNAVDAADAYAYAKENQWEINENILRKHLEK